MIDKCLLKGIKGTGIFAEETLFCGIGLFEYIIDVCPELP